MRVNSNMLRNTVVYNINQNYKEFDTYYNQATSQKKVRYVSDSPIDSVNQLKYKSENAKYKQYIENIGDAKDWLNLEDSVLSQNKEALDRVRVLTLQGSNASYTQEQRANIAQEINELLETIVEQANTTIGGSFLFGGTEILNDPYNNLPFQVERGTSGDGSGAMKDVITKVEYIGDFQPVYREIENNSKIQINENGNEVFMATPNKIQFPQGTNDPTSKLSTLNGIDADTTEKGYFKVNDTKIYYNVNEDSLLDIKNKINLNDNGVTANVEGQYVTNKIFDTTASVSTTGGNFTINGVEISLTNTDTISDVINKINAVSGKTGVTADLNSDKKMVINGGFKVTGSNTALTDALGITSLSMGTVTEDYNLVMSSKNNHQIFVTELGNSNLLRKINVLSNEPGTNAPNNLTSEATAEKMTVFDVLIKVRDDLLNDNVEDLNGEDIGYIDSAIDNIMTRTGSVGAKVNRLESVENRLSTLKYNNETLLADAEGIDLTEVYTKLQEIQSVQTAALKVGAQIFNLSLMNYL